ncbi:hypothetical protein AVEN_273900-1, partial [Araneus ventricosus]
MDPSRVDVHGNELTDNLPRRLRVIHPPLRDYFPEQFSRKEVKTRPGGRCFSLTTGTRKKAGTFPILQATG